MSEEEKKVVYAPEIKEASKDEKEIFALGSQIIYHISDFDGPLDLLVEMLKDNKIPIEDLFISEITSQYVEVIKSTPVEELDYEYAGDFIVTAAELLWLKSLRSLPNDEDEMTEDDPEYLRQQLILKVKEYALMKEQAEKLKTLETVNRFYREPKYDEKDFRIALTNFNLENLMKAYAKVLITFERTEAAKIPKKVIREKFSVTDQMTHIELFAREKKEFDFESLFEPDYDRSDIVTTFLAILELLRYQKLRAEQDELFGKIKLFYIEENSDSLVSINEEDYK